MDPKENLIATLTSLRQEMARGHTVIGSYTSVVAGPGATGNIVGESVSVIATGPGNGGSVVGKSVSVVVGGPTPDYGPLMSELGDIIEAVREDKATKSWIEGLLSRIGSLGNRALDSFVSGAASALGAYAARGGS